MCISAWFEQKDPQSNPIQSDTTQKRGEDPSHHTSIKRRAMATTAAATTTAAASEEAAAPAPAPAPAPADEEAAFEAFATCNFARALRLALAELLLGDDAESEGADGAAVAVSEAAVAEGVPLILMPGTPACSVALTEACSRCVLSPHVC